VAARLIDGKAVAAAIRAEVAAEARALARKLGRAPALAVVLAGEDPASRVYVRNKQRACEEAGFLSQQINLPVEASQAEVLAAVAGLNADPGVDAILVQLPLPRQVDEAAVLEAVSPDKDADGFHPLNLGRLMMGRPVFIPCTPAGIVELLVRSGVETRGARVVIVGRSNIVGKPLANLLVQKGARADATVTVCHTRTRDLARHTREADVLVAAAGSPELITGEMVAPGAVVIDVGMNRVEGRLVGDVHFAQVSEVASAITPVPGGVGPMTVAMLLRNTLLACQRFFSTGPR
jgi:methylenetetrahydrofolate dehydrogenase (NADP+)/methenyltetrahydrofolate cyclohydrolase